MSEIDDILKGAPAYKPDATSNPSKASRPVESEIDAALKDAPSTARGVGGLAKDVGAWALKGAVAVPEAVVGLADIPTGGAVGKFLENEGGMVGFRPKQANEAINEWHTDATKEAQRKYQQAEGFGGKFMAAVENPSNIVGSVIESAPSMFAGGLVGRGLLGATRLGQMGAKGAALAGSAGEGVMSAGSAAEQIRQETADGRLTPEQSTAAAATGLSTFGIGALSGKLANKLGIGDIDTMLAQGKAGIAKQAADKAASAAVNPMVQQAAKSIPRQVIEGAISEGLLEELPQSVSEQVIQNLALGKPWYEDVDTSAVMGVLSGGAMGAGAAGYQGFLSRGEPAQTPVHPPQTPPTEPDQPYTGPTLALPAPPQGSIEVGSDGTARTPEYQRPRYVGDMAGDITDVMPKPEGVQTTAHVDPVRQSVQQAADAGGALSSAALTAIDSGAAQAAQPATAYEPPVISLEEADAIDQAAYEQFFSSMDADPVVGRYLEDDNDIPDFGAASNTSDEDFLRAMGATDKEINDAIATTRQSAIQASRAAGNAGAQANEPAGPLQAARAAESGQEGQVTTPTIGAQANAQAGETQQAISEQPQTGSQAPAARARAGAAGDAAPNGGRGIQAAGLTNGSTTISNDGARAAPQTGAQGQAQGAEPEFTTLKTVDGYTVTVRTSDLNSDKPRLRQYTKDGKSKAVPAIARDNLDPAGEKRAANAVEDASNPLFNVITAKNGNAFASESAAARELNRVGMGATHEVVQADSVQPGVQGFLIRRKQGEAMEPAGQTTATPTNNIATPATPTAIPVATDQAPTSETAQPKAVVAAQPAPPSTPSKPVPNPAALQRIAEGKAYFFSRDKADAFVADNALADGYEVVQDNKRFVVQAKKPATTAGVAQQATDAATQEQGGDNNTPANEREESSKPAAPAQQPADTDLASIFERLDRRGRMKSAAEAEAKAHPRAEQIAAVQDQFHDILLALMEQGKLEVNGQKSLTEDNKSCL